MSTDPIGSERLANYDPGRSLCNQIERLEQRVKLLCDLVFQLAQKINGDQQPHQS
jgi:archaellum component FlaC